MGTKRQRKGIVGPVRAGVLASILWAIPTLAQETATVATIEGIEGEVLVRRRQDQSFVPAAQGMQLYALDTIKTGSHSRAALHFTEGGFLRVAETSVIELKPQDTLAMSKGKAYYFARDRARSHSIETPIVSTAIRGTELAIEVSDAGTEVTVIDGSVTCSNPAGSLALKPGERGVTRPGQAPQKEVLVNPIDAVQWSFRVPFLLSSEDIATRGGGGPDIGEALAVASAGDLTEALKILESRGATHHPDGALVKAAILASLGSLQEAGSILDGIKGAEGGRFGATVNALQAIIAVSGNQLADANRFLMDSQTAEAPSPLVSLAYSLLAQAGQDLAKARQVLDTESSHPGILVRRAELAMGFGELHEAERLAQEALHRQPGFAQAHLLLGFIHLVRGNSGDARQAFEQAAVADPSMADAHLGLGLIAANTGDLGVARKQFEEASFLSPNRAVYRSYLGKTHFEENNGTAALHEFDRAKSIDPNDPTPYLYSAYTRLAKNDVVGALQDVEKSRALNRNRGVYRSSTLLDQDAGVKSAGLAEIFTALGFSRAAELEAIRSLSQDYTNVAAHRLLADSSTTIQEADARTTEMAIADILSPLTLNLFGREQSQPSLNDYSAFFNRPQSRTYLDFFGRTQDQTVTPSGQFTAIGSTGGYTLRSGTTVQEGGKSGDYLRQFQSAAVGSWQPSAEHRFNVGGEATYDRSRVIGAEPEMQRLEGYAMTASYRGTFSPHDTVIAMLRGGVERNQTATPMVVAPYVIETSVDGNVVEQFDATRVQNQRTYESINSSVSALQHVHQRHSFTAVSGVEFRTFSVKRAEDSTVNDWEIEQELNPFGSLGNKVVSRGTPDLDAVDAYSYWTFRPVESLAITGGASYTSLEFEGTQVPEFSNAQYRRNHANPKAGVVYMPTSWLTVRGAYFETLRRSVLENDRTLEPTVSGGFTQLYTDQPGVQSRSFGGGVDIRLPGQAYFGGEVLYRFLDTPRPDENIILVNYEELTGDLTFAGGIRQIGGNQHSTQDLYRAYYYQVLCNRAAASVDYRRIIFNSTDPLLPNEVRNHRVETSIRGFTEEGFYPFVTATWRQQERIASPIGDGTSAFWLLDAGIGYRLPRRQGNITVSALNILDKQFVLDQTIGADSLAIPGFGGGVRMTFNF